MIIDIEKIKQAIFEGTRTEASERTGLSLRTIDGYRTDPTKSGYRDWQGISLKTAIEISNKLEERKMKKIRLELNNFDGSKRRKLGAAIESALEELELYNDEYFDRDYNQIDSLQSGLSNEELHDTQAVVVVIGAPNVMKIDGLDVIFSDEEEGADGGYEQVVSKFEVDDLKERDVHVLLTYDI